MTTDRCSPARRWSLVSLAALAWLAGASSIDLPASAAGANQAPRPSSASGRELLDKYCVTCHNEKLKTAGLALDTANLAQVGSHADTWEKVITKLRMRTMPPPGRPRPEGASYDALAAWLEGEIDRAVAANPNPGRTEAIHRINRTEYQNAVRDLLGVDVDGAAMLPADDADEQGFDNTANVLAVSPALMERYLSAARKVTRLAIGPSTSLPSTSLRAGRATAVPVIETYTLPPLLYQEDRMSEELPFGTRGGVAVRHHFPADGEYTIKLRLARTYVDCIKGIGQPHQIDVRLDHALVKQFRIGGEAKGKPAPSSFCNNLAGDPEWEWYIHEADSGLEARFAAKAGPHVVGVTFPREMFEPEGILQPASHGFSFAIDETPDGLPSIDSVTIAGPYEAAGPGDTPSRRKIFTCRPDDPPSERSGAGLEGPRKRSEPSGAKGPPRVINDEACALQILSAIARRAYRRPIGEKDIQTLLRFYREGRQSKTRDGSFDAGIQMAIERVLVDPDFLFRIERDPAGARPGTVYRLTDLELASRLSFFLWSSIPDDPLLDAAARGRLRDPAVLEQQVHRMLADERSKALVDNFAGQWLMLRNMRTVAPDAELFADFDENLRDAFRQETELFFASQLREDRGVPELLTANYTFLNERLARHYGVRNVYGNHFRRVTLGDGDHRGGLLTHGSLLTVTSYPNRTSPVLRGKWILGNLIGTPPPPPPPDVPGLPEKGPEGRPATVRERLELHRRNPMCATCHAPMDPLGFALENYDAIGRWRTRSETGGNIDASGTLPSGASFSGPTGLRDVLLGHEREFVSTVTAKLLGYALGRAVQPFDSPTVRKIVRNAQPSGYRWSAIVMGIAASTPFQMRKSADRSQTE